MEDLKDGAAATLLLAETGVGNGPWSAGGPATVRGLDPARQPYIGRARQFGGLHRRGLNVAFADGSVRFLKDTIDPKVFEALSTIAGGEQLPPGWDK
jgi:prepilin-type processing-associated H-X9-DG protein